MHLLVIFGFLFHFAIHAQEQVYEFVGDDSTSGFATDAKALDAFLGRFDPSKCRLTYQQASQIKCAVGGSIANENISADSQISQLYDSVESEVFIDMTRKLQAVTQCQKTEVDSFFGNADKKKKVQQQFVKKFNQRKEALQKIAAELTKQKNIQRNLAQGNYRGMGAKAPNAAAVTKAIRELEAGQEAIIRELPFGHQPAVKQQMLTALKRGGSGREIYAAMEAGLKDFQSQLSSSQKRLDWALASPDRAIRYHNIRDAHCSSRRGRLRNECLQNLGADANSVSDQAYGNRVGKPGITNQFKQELLGGDLRVLENYLSSVGQGSPTTDTFMCNVKANHIDGAKIEKAGKVALEIGGIAALSLAFPPGAVAVRGAAMSRNLLGLNSLRAGASYVASMTPLIPSVARACGGDSSPAFLNFANFSSDKQCSSENALGFAQAESQFNECATEVAFASLEALSGLGLGKAIRRLAGSGSDALSTRRAGRAVDASSSGDEIVVTAKRTRSAPPTRSIRGGRTELTATAKESAAIRTAVDSDKLDSATASVLHSLQKGQQVEVEYVKGISKGVTKKMSREEALKLLQDSDLYEMRIVSASPQGRSARLSASQANKVDPSLRETLNLRSDRLVTVMVEYPSGEMARFTGNAQMIRELATRKDIVKISSGNNAPGWIENSYKISARARTSGDPLNRFRQQLSSGDVVKKGSELGYDNTVVYHGTIQGLEDSVKSGPKNVGTGFGGRGLYLATENEKQLAETYAGHARVAAVNRAKNVKTAEEAANIDRSSIVMKGRLNPDKEFKVGVFTVSRDAYRPDLSKGVLPPNWDDDPRLRKLLESEFDVVEIRGTKSGGLNISSDRFLVVHERAGKDAILWENTERLGSSQ